MIIVLIILTTVKSNGTMWKRAMACYCRLVSRWRARWQHRWHQRQQLRRNDGDWHFILGMISSRECLNDHASFNAPVTGINRIRRRRRRRRRRLCGVAISMNSKTLKLVLIFFLSSPFFFFFWTIIHLWISRQLQTPSCGHVFLVNINISILFSCYVFICMGESPKCAAPPFLLRPLEALHPSA